MIKELQTVFSDMLDSMINFIPQLFIALIVLAVGYIAGRIIQWIVVRLASVIKLDEIVGRTGLMSENDDPGLVPSKVFGRFLFWVVFLNFMMAGFEAMGLGDAVQPLRELIGYLPRLIVAAVILIIGSLAANFVAELIEGGVANTGIEFHQTIGAAAKVIMMGIVFIIVMQQLGIDTSLIANLFIILVALMIGGTALAFALGGNGVARNVLAGYYARDMFASGDDLEIDGERGILTGIGTLNAQIERDGSQISIPNTRLVEGVVRRIAS